MRVLCVFDQDSSSVVEWAQSPREKSQSHQLLETQLSYETEWDMVNAVSFKKKSCVNGEGESVNFLLADDARCAQSVSVACNSKCVF